MAANQMPDDDRFPTPEAYANDRDIQGGVDVTFAQVIPFTPEAPQPLLREIPLGAAFPVQALGPLRGAVEAVQGMTLAPVAIPAASALAVASLAVQGFLDVDTLGGRRPVSLYFLTIARSGERKSSCDAPLMAALRAFEKDQAQAQREDTASWQNSYALWKGERDRILSEARNGKGEKRAAAEADLRALGREPVAPPSTDRTVTEPTYEGLIRKYSEGMPTLGIFSDEGGQFLGGFAMSTDNRQKTLAALNDLWQGNPIRRTRAGEGSFTLFGRRLAIHLMVQPGVASAFMADPMTSDTGFPAGLTPDIPAADYALDPRAIKIAAAAARLNDLRENWLNPADLVKRVPEVVPGYPDRLLPVSPEAEAVMKKRTLTNLYNAKPAWLQHAHTALDEAVAEAYGWGDDWRAGKLTDDESLSRLFHLNQTRAKAQSKPQAPMVQKKGDK